MTLQEVSDRINRIYLGSTDPEGKWLARYTVGLVNAALEAERHLARLAGTRYAPRVALAKALEGE